MLEALKRWYRDRQARGVRFAAPLRFSLRCRLGFHDWHYGETGFTRKCDRCHVIESGSLLL